MEIPTILETADAEGKSVAYFISQPIRWGLRSQAILTSNKSHICTKMTIEGSIPSVSLSKRMMCARADWACDISTRHHSTTREQVRDRGMSSPTLWRPCQREIEQTNGEVLVAGRSLIPSNCVALSKKAMHTCIQYFVFVLTPAPNDESLRQQILKTLSDFRMISCGMFLFKRKQEILSYQYCIVHRIIYNEELTHIVNHKFTVPVLLPVCNQLKGMKVKLTSGPKTGTYDFD